MLTFTDQTSHPYSIRCAPQLIGTAAYRSIAETVWDSCGMMPVVRIYSIAAVDAHAKSMWHHKSVIGLFQIVLRLLADLIALIVFAFRQRRATAAEILVLRRQIALYQERGIKPRRIDAVTRISLALLSRLFNWRDTLVVVRPETVIRWHRAGWKLFWRLKSRPGRPPVPLEIQAVHGELKVCRN